MYSSIIHGESKIFKIQYSSLRDSPSSDLLEIPLPIHIVPVKGNEKIHTIYSMVTAFHRREKNQKHLHIFLMYINMHISQYVQNNMSVIYCVLFCSDNNQFLPYPSGLLHWQRQWNNPAEYGSIGHRKEPGPRLNIKTVFPGYEDSHVKDKTVARPSYL